MGDFIVAWLVYLSFSSAGHGIRFVNNSRRLFYLVSK